MGFEPLLDYNSMRKEDRLIARFACCPLLNISILVYMSCSCLGFGFVFSLNKQIKKVVYFEVRVCLRNFSFGKKEVEKNKSSHASKLA